MKLLAVLLASAAVKAASVPATCRQDRFTLPDGASIERIAAVSNNGSYGEGAADIAYPTNPTNLPELCALIVKVISSPQSSYRFGLFLPANWNSRFIAVGNGGFAGGINWLDMGAPVKYGFASMSTDTGHNSTLENLSWALNNEETKKDFGYRAMHGSVALAKQLVAQYYGVQAKYSYYSGCSTGGRQGLKEAQLHPESFDGMMIGAPAWWTSHLQSWTTWIGTLNLPASDPKHIPAQLFSAIGAEARKQCDGVDGVMDGIVSLPDKCNFNLSTLLCGTPGVSTSACLTKAQIETAKQIYGDYYAEGRFAFPGLSISSEPLWVVLAGGTEPNKLGYAYLQYFLLNNASWPWQSYTDDLLWQADAADPGDATADDSDMAPFRERGGKIFMYHGDSDALIATRSSDYFYEQVGAATGGTESVRDWFRYFRVPGMSHCSGTFDDAPWYFAGANQPGALSADAFSVPGFSDSRHDALLALVDWVEEGKPIDEIVATTWERSSSPSSGVLRQRPLCPYPEIAKWDGSGNVNKSESWACKKPCQK